MRLIPGGTEEAGAYLWPIQPLKWWRGENSVRYSKNPYADKGLPEAVELAAVLQKHRGKPPVSLVVDKEHGDPYPVTMKDARGAFREYAEVGTELLYGNIDLLSRFRPFRAFVKKYGVPCDGDFEHLDDIYADVRIAALCYQLLNLVHQREWAAIRQMAVRSTDEQGAESVTFHVLDRQRSVFAMLPPVKLSEPSTRTSYLDWKRAALEAVQAVTEINGCSLRVVPDKKNQLVLAPSGLKTMMWLAFWLEINGLLELADSTKTCLQTERFHGCGRQFVPSNPRQKLCPECRARAATEAQARWRSKRRAEEM